MPAEHEFFFSDLPTRIRLAGELYHRCGAQLRADRQVREALNALDRLAEELRARMHHMGMFELCSWCGSRPLGGCCSAEMAGEADALLLLGNLLLGSKAVPQREADSECCFLGPQGCCLRLKPIFCLNYNCPRILSGNSREGLAALARATARLHREQLALEGLLLERLP